MAKKTVYDVTKQPQALTEEDVNAQDSATRLWQSLSTTYGQRAEESDKAYNKSISAASRSALQRGMGRSSYAVQDLSNLLQEKVKANDNIWREQIADYQNRLTSLEQQERAEQFQREQFEYQKERDENADQQWQQSFDYQQGRDKTADEQWQKSFDASQNQWQQSFDYQKGRDKTADKQWQQQFNYGKDRDKVSDQQWQKSFDQQDKNAQQQVAIQYLNQMLQNGGTPSDELLKQAGISRKDYEQMKKKQTVVYKKPKTQNDPNSKGTNNPQYTAEQWLYYMQHPEQLPQYTIRMTEERKY